MLNWSSCQPSLWRIAICIGLREVMLRTWVNDSRVEGPSLLPMLLPAHNCNGGLSDGVQEMLNWST